MEFNQILHGDCCQQLQKMSSEVVTATIFSPPYDAVRDYKGFFIDFVELGTKLYRVTKEGGIAAVVIQDGTTDGAKSLTSFRLAVDWADQCGWRLFETCIYSRHGRPGAWWNKRFRVDHEYIHIFLKGDRPSYFNKEPLKIKAIHAGSTWHGTQRKTDGTTEVVAPKVQNDYKCRGTIWKYNTSNSEGNPLKLKHPASYPDALASDLIQCFSQEDDLILDPTCGSGTTCVVAAQLKRRYLGIEIAEEYVEIAKQRLKNEVVDGVNFEMEKS